MPADIHETHRGLRLIDLLRPHWKALTVALVAVLGETLTVVGAISAYFEKYLTTSVSQWVAHDLRRTLYHHIQRLSLADHDEARTGDLITRVTSDIGAIQDFINSARLGILVDVTTLVGMIGVMFYLNWRFTLIALSVSPALFLVVFYYPRRIKRASRRRSKTRRDTAVRRAGGAHVHPRGQGLRQGRQRGGAVRI